MQRDHLFPSPKVEQMAEDMPKLDLLYINQNDSL
jgi:hypothetical protein